MRKIPRLVVAALESFEIVLFSIDKALFFVRSKLSRDYYRPRRRNKGNKRKIFNSPLLLVYPSIRVTLYSDCSFASYLGGGGEWKFLDSRFMKRPRRWNLPLKFNVFNLNSQRSLRNVTELCNVGKNIGNSFSSQGISILEEKERERGSKRRNLSVHPSIFRAKWKFSRFLFIGNNFCISRPPEFLVSFVHIIINFPAGIDG